MKSGYFATTSNASDHEANEKNNHTKDKSSYKESDDVWIGRESSAFWKNKQLLQASTTSN